MSVPPPPATYQELIARLQAFWMDEGCVVMQPYHTEVGAGTFNPATFLRALDSRPWKVAYVEPSIRPTDGRYGENPYRFGHYYQYQVLLKPSPDDVVETYIRSLEALGVDPRAHDLRFVEDNWEGPTLGAWGAGWEVWLDGMEVTQFTYFQQAGGIDLDPISVELTYGLERLAMYLQGKESAFDVVWAPGVTWGDVYREYERQWSIYNFEVADTDALQQHFRDHEARVRALPRGRRAARGLRPGAEVLARLQPARRARRHLGDRSRRLHRPRAQPRAPRRAGARRDGRAAGRGGDRRMSTFLIEIGCEELPATHCEAALAQAGPLVEWLLAERRLHASSLRTLVAPRRIAVIAARRARCPGGRPPRAPRAARDRRLLARRRADAGRAPASRASTAAPRTS